MEKSPLFWVKNKITLKIKKMKNLLNTIAKTSLGKGFLLVTALFLLVAVICSVILLLLGLWNDNIIELFTGLFNNLIDVKGKLLAFYLICCILFGLTGN